MTRGTRGAVSPTRRAVLRVVRAVVPPVLVCAILGLLLPLAMGSIAGAVLALGVAGILILLVTAGLEGTAVTLLGLGFVFAPMNDVNPVAAISFVTVSDVFFAMGVGVLIPTLMMRGFPRQAPFLIGTGGIILVGLLTSIESTATGASLNGLLRLVVGALTLPIVFMIWRPGRTVLVTFVAAFILGNGISVMQGLISGVRSADSRYIGLTEHPNILGLVSVLSVALVPFLYNETPKAYRWVVLGAGAVSAYGIWISGSRAALIAVVAVVVMYLLLSRSVEHALIFFGLAIAPLYLLGQNLTKAASDSDPLGRLRGAGSADLSDVDREQLAAKALDRFVAHPILGTGFGDATLAHNIYLQIAAAGGLAALVCYLLILFAAVRQPIKLGGHYRLLALPLLAYALIGPLTPLLWDRYIWCVLGLPFLVPLLEKPVDEAEPAVEALSATPGPAEGSRQRG